MNQHTDNKLNNSLPFNLEPFSNLDQFDSLQRKNQYSIILLQGVRFNLKVDFSEYLLDENHVVCLAPYQLFMIRSEEACSGYMLNFNINFFCTYCHQNELEIERILFGNFYGFPFFKLLEKAFFINLIDQMTTELKRDSIAQLEVLVTFLKVFLIESVRQKKIFDKEPDRKLVGIQAEILQKLLNAIEHNYTKLHAPRDYANLLLVSSRTLNGIAKKYLNQTLTDLIINRIIIAAKRELYLTSKPIKQIAANLGYDDEFYFSRLFKKKVGVSPIMYRNTLSFTRL